MPRIVFLGIFILVAVIPFLFFGALRGCSDPDGFDGGYYSSGPRFYYFGYSRGRGYSSGGYQGGGFSFGK